VNEKPALHPRNRHTGRYDFPKLTAGTPELARFTTKNPDGEPTIDFSDPIAVRVLNRALLKLFYGVSKWEIPTDYLCPPIPGRADYLHHLADLLASSNGAKIPRDSAVRALDIGTGASGIYPIIGHLEYGWNFVGSETDPTALASVEKIIRANPGLSDGIELRRQPSTMQIFRGVVNPGENFDVTLCNPPFHSSAEEAREGSRRKWRNLGRGETGTKRAAPVLNFGGQSSELWCPGGEVAFVGRMIEESSAFANQIFWFSSLVSKGARLEEVYRALEDIGAADWRTLEMGQGQKISRAVAWTFLDKEQRSEWRARRWKKQKEESL
jgi:23S rRNA (adenine1618-N6)-methyltransferase